LVCTDSGDTLVVLQTDPRALDRYEVIEEDEERGTTKICPIMQIACMECKCAWYEKSDGRCAVFARLLD